MFLSIREYKAKWRYPFQSIKNENQNYEFYVQKLNKSLICVFKSFTKRINTKLCTHRQKISNLKKKNKKSFCCRWYAFERANSVLNDWSWVTKEWKQREESEMSDSEEPHSKPNSSFSFFALFMDRKVHLQIGCQTLWKHFALCFN